MLPLALCHMSQLCHNFVAFVNVLCSGSIVQPFTNLLCFISGFFVRDTTRYVQLLNSDL